METWKKLLSEIQMKSTLTSKITFTIDSSNFNSFTLLKMEKLKFVCKRIDHVFIDKYAICSNSSIPTPYRKQTPI